MKIRSLALCAVAAVLPLAAAACGGDDDNNSGERPSPAAIEEGLRKVVPTLSSAPDEAVSCWAENLEGSDLPNGVLRAIAEGRDPEIDADNEDEYTEIAESSAEECAAAAMAPAGDPTTEAEDPADG